MSTRSRRSAMEKGHAARDGLRPAHGRGPSLPAYSAQRGGGLVNPESVLALQRTAGNQAVAGLLSASAGSSGVQRLAVSSTDVEPEVGRKSKLTGLLGRSTYGMIASTLRDYEKATAANDQIRYLEKLSNLCAKWLNEHSGSRDKQDDKRRPIVRRLLDELPAEQVKLSKAAAQDIYMGNVANAGDTSGKDPFALKALNQGGKMAAESGASKEGRQLAQEKGLTEAEVAAIRVFTASDYTYINPTTANNPAWLKAQKGKAELGLEGFTDKTLTEEGTLHAGMAMEGLKKLEPYREDTFRGSRFTEEEFQKEVMGGKISFASFASSAVKEETALDFAHGIGIEYKHSANKDIAVLYVIQLGGGRDIAKLSAVKKEGEVLILPGSTYAVLSISEVDGASKYAQYVSKAQAMGQPIPRKWYVVNVAPIPKQKAPEPPKASV